MLVRIKGIELYVNIDNTGNSSLNLFKHHNSLEIQIYRLNVIFSKN